MLLEATVVPRQPGDGGSELGGGHTQVVGGVGCRRWKQSPWQWSDHRQKGPRVFSS